MHNIGTTIEEGRELIRTRSKILALNEIDAAVLSDSHDFNNRSVIFEKDSRIYTIISGKLRSNWEDIAIPARLSIKMSDIIPHRYDFEYQFTIIDGDQAIFIWMIDPYSLTRLDLIDDAEGIYNTFAGVPAELLECDDTEWNKRYVEQFKKYDEAPQGG